MRVGHQLSCPVRRRLYCASEAVVFGQIALQKVAHLLLVVVDPLDVGVDLTVDEIRGTSGRACSIGQHELELERNEEKLGSEGSMVTCAQSE